MAPNQPFLRSTPDPELNAVLAEFLSSARDLLQVRFVGMYLHGSLAVGDFDRHSDVDFVIAITRDVSDEELPALQRMHARIHALPSQWAQRLDGTYLTTEMLRRALPDNPLHLYLDNGASQLVRSDHDNYIRHRYILREKSLTLAGPSPLTLIDPVSPDAIQTEARELLRSWIGPYIADSAPLGNAYSQPYTVVTLCRLLYTWQHGDTVSKRAAAQWASSVLDERWIPLIQRAWYARSTPALTAHQPANSADLAATVEFIRYALTLSSNSLKLIQLHPPLPLGPYPQSLPSS